MFGIDSRIAEIIGIVVATVLVFLAGWEVNGWRWEVKYHGLEDTYAKAAKRTEDLWQAKQANMQDSFNKLRDVKDAQIDSVNKQLSVALVQLRNRPLRAAGTGLSTGTGGNCTGAQLYREDSEFLAREAARADAVVAERDSCYARYNAIKDELYKAGVTQ